MSSKGMLCVFETSQAPCCSSCRCAACLRARCMHTYHLQAACRSSMRRDMSIIELLQFVHLSCSEGSTEGPATCPSAPHFAADATASVSARRPRPKASAILADHFARSCTPTRAVQQQVQRAKGRQGASCFHSQPLLSGCLLRLSSRSDEQLEEAVAHARMGLVL